METLKELLEFHENSRNNVLEKMQNPNIVLDKLQRKHMVKDIHHHEKMIVKLTIALDKSNYKLSSLALSLK